MTVLAADGGGAGGSFGDALPGEEPQAIEDRNDRLDTDARQAWPEPESYNFVYANGQFHISDSHEHAELAEHSGISMDHTGPMAVGRVIVDMGKATFEIKANVSAQGLARVLKDYCKQTGWRWGGMVDLQGEPVGTGSEFAPVKSYALQWVGHLNELKIAKRANSASFMPVLHVDDFRASAWLHGRLGKDAFEALRDFCVDEGLTLYGGNDNVLKRHEDLEIDNNYTPEWNDNDDHFLFDDPPDERKPGGVYRCPDCQRIFPNWGIYTLHRQKENGLGSDQTQDSKFPELNMDATFPPHFDEMRQEPGIHTGGYENTPAPRVTVIDPATAKWNDYELGWRRPVVWDRRNNHIGLGHPGNYHHDVESQMDPYPIHATHGWVSVPREDSGQEFDQGNGPEYGLKMRCNNPEDLLPFLSQHLTPYEPHAAEHIDDIDYGALNEKDLWTGKVAAGTDPKDLLTAPVPFIYDIDQDTITVGQMGQRQADIPGKFTPGGIVEGTYEPGGQVLIRSMTNMPYSVRHMLELWTYNQSHMEIKSIHMQDDEGKRTKLASQDIGSYLRTLAAADPAVWRAYNALKGAGGTVYIVGGAVRDAIMGKEPNDLDLMVTGLPQDDVRHILSQLPGSMAGTGAMKGKDEDGNEIEEDTAHAFGVFHYREKSGHSVEIALPRREQSSGSGSKGFDKTVDHTMTPEEDLYRRDFTANAMAVNLDTGQLIDPFNGSSDVRQRHLRTLHTKSLGDDPLRTLRALTALSKHGLYPTEETKAQMTKFAPELQHVPAERKQKELDKILDGDNPGEALRAAQETGVLQHFLPEVARTYGWTQNDPHHELELFDHLLNVLERTKERKPKDTDFALAGLLHDIGKKDAHWTECRSCGANHQGHALPCPACGSDDTSGHFYKKRLEDGTSLGADHETLGAEQVRALMNRLKYPNDRIKRVTDLVQHHMFPAFNTEKGARRFLMNVGDNADDLLHLRWADQGGKSEYPTDPSLSVDTQMALINQARAAKAPTNKSMLALKGGELFKQVPLPEGPQRGQLLNWLTDQVIDNPELNTPDALLGLAQTWKTSQTP